jgi:hypothetical protein
MSNRNPMLGRFLKFSAEVTGFTAFELRGTGMAEAYLDAVERVVGRGVLRELLDAYDRLEGATGADRADRLRQEVFGNEKLGPVARNVIKMWYIGAWYALPREWTETFGAIPENQTFMVSATAYTEGLLWPAVGANPPGAKAPGYGSWADAPVIPGLTQGVSGS